MKRYSVVGDAGHYEKEDGIWIKYSDYEAEKSAICEANSNAVLAEVRAMKCCGNCFYMDIIQDYGGICEFDKNNKVPIDRIGICDDWKLFERD